MKIHAQPIRSLITPVPEARRAAAAAPGWSNQALQRMLRAGAIQAKLTVNQPGDRYEQEADRVADTVMRMTELDEVELSESPPAIQRQCAACAAGSQTCPECEEEQEVRRKEVSGATPEVTAGTEAGVSSLRGGGKSLAEAERAFFEPRFGRDLGGVRIHTGARAAESARSLGAAAYTLGSDIVFGEGRYAPGTEPGRRLLAHEITHVLQQSSPGEIRRECDPPPANPCSGRPLRSVIQAFQTASNWLPNARQRMQSYIADPTARNNRPAAQALLRHFNWTEAVRSQLIYPEIPGDIVQVIDRTLTNITVPLGPNCPTTPRQGIRGNDHTRVFASSPGVWERTNCYDFYPDYFTRTTAVRRAKTALHEMMHSWEEMSDIFYAWESGYPGDVRNAQSNADSYASLIRDLGH